MTIQNKAQLQKYQEAAALSTQILQQLHQAIKPGVTPLEIDALADKLCKQYQVRPSFKGAGNARNPYQYVTCVSVNEVVVHGIPNNRPFQIGDVIKVDFGLIKDGLQTDHCFTLGLAPLTARDERLIMVSRDAVQAAVKLALAGKHVGDLSFAMQSTVEQAGFNVAKEFVGHGIGREMHEAPQVPAYGRKGTGEKLVEGMVICLEAQVLAGSDELIFTRDGWSVTTRDGSKAAMFEYMVVVGKNKPRVLTPTMNWQVVR